MTSSTVPKKWHRDWLAWLLVVTVLYAVVCLVSLATDVGRPFPGFFTYHNLIIGRMDMVRNAPSWWWQIADGQLTIADTILQVEDTPFTGFTIPLNEAPIYQQAWDNGQQTISILVQHGAERRQFTIPLLQFSWRHYFDFMFAPIVICATLLILAWLLYRAAPTNKTQRLAATLLCLMAILAIGVHPSLFNFDQPIDYGLTIGNITTTLAGVSLGLVFYQFSLNFPYFLAIRTSWLGTWLLILTIIVGIFAYLGARIIVFTQGLTPLVRQLDTIYFYLWIGLILIGVLFLSVRLVADSFWLPNERRQRQEARILLVGLLVMLPATLLVGHYLVNDVGSIIRLNMLADSRFFPLALPLAFAAISLRYHTFAGAQRWFFLALLLAGSGLVANLGTALLFWNHQPLIRETSVPPTIILFLLFSAVGLLWGWQTGWYGWLGRVFAWERVGYHIVEQIGEQLLSQRVYEETTVAHALATTLATMLEVERTAVWVMQTDHLALVAQAGNWPSTLPDAIQSHESPLSRPLHSRDFAKRWPELAALPITAIIPLVNANDTLGLIAVGPRWDTAVLDEHDLEILTVLGQQATLFLQNSRQTAQLRQRDQQMMAALTHAHQKTAQDLHDHLLPLLTRAQLNLLALPYWIETQPDLARQTASSSQEALAASAELVRRIQHGLVIRPLEFGLRAYLLDMTSRVEQETQLTIEQQLPPDMDERLTSLTLREALYAIWQQALDNIQRHAQANTVQISLVLTAAQGQFSICDDGQGSNQIQRHQAMRNGRFGLRSMHIRLENVGGKLTFQSEPGQGSCVIGKFPINGQE
ncbi:MAG: ATP-binding protein [Candidatus Promineifilaceae bacterium]